MKKLDYTVIGILVLWTFLPAWLWFGFGIFIGSGEGLGFDIGSQLTNAAIFGLLWVGYRVWEKRKNKEEKKEMDKKQ